MKSVLKRVKFVVLKPWVFFKRLSFKKKLLVIVILLIGIALAVTIIGSITNKPKHTFATAQKEDITETVTETGTITTSGQIEIYSPTNGIIENIYIKNGDIVEEKQELFTVKSSATEQEKQHAYANYMSAKTSLDAAQATLHTLQADMLEDWDRYKKLAEGDKYENSDGTPKADQRTLPEFHIAEKDWLAAEARYKNQQAVITQAQAQSASTYLLYQATQNAVVKAPISGTISNLSTTTGNSVKIYTPTSPAPPVLTVANITTTEVLVALSENDVAKVSEGQEAEVKVNAAGNKIYKGTVARVDMIGVENQGVIRYSAYIEILDPDNKLRPGMNTDATIITNKLSNVLTVPNSAIKPYQGGRAVRIVKNGKIEYLPVKIGIRGAKNTQIISGIEEGQEVVTALSNEQIKRPGIFGN